jgi:hypothetical protein
MAIDRSGKWWTGSEAADIREYLEAYKAQGYTVHEARLCTCGCGSVEFNLEADRDEGCARRSCVHCGTKHLICDSGEYWSDADPESWACVECAGVSCNLAVGFSLYEQEQGEEQAVRWISIGNRCVRCGPLGSFVDWKVGYSPSYQLLDQV